MKLAFFFFVLPLLPAVSAQSILERVNGNAGDSQTSLTLDQNVIARGFAKNGQEIPTPGQVPSLTSTNNFINFCLTTGLQITNGQQVTKGSCNPTPMGSIPSVDKMPSSKFIFPNINSKLIEKQSFEIRMSVIHLTTGNFVNAETNYYAAPQQLDKDGFIIGHSHVVIQQLTAFDQTDPVDPQNFVFFKGLNNAAQNGILTAEVTNGLPSGVYRISSINGAANHQPVLAPVAQHGSMDDAVYFTVVPAGAANDTGTAAATGAAAATPTNGKAKTGAGGGKKQHGKRRFAREIA